MRSYTTYHIPETHNHQTGTAGKWLWLIVPGTLSDEAAELLKKISAALKANFEEDVALMTIGDQDMISFSDLPGNRLKLIISFGIAPEQSGLWIDLPKPGMCVLEPMTFILTLHPEVLQSNALAKKELWRHMQMYLESQSS